MKVQIIVHTEGTWKKLIVLMMQGILFSSPHIRPHLSHARCFALGDGSDLNMGWYCRGEGDKHSALEHQEDDALEYF